MSDITPTFELLPAEKEVVLPALPSDAAASPSIGGFQATPNGLQQGKVILNSAGEQILIGSATAPLTGIGVFIGNAGDGTYDFRAGDPAGNYIQWDASAAILTVVGVINVTAGGTVGGFNVGADYLRDNADSFGLASTITGGDDVRFWAGSSFANRATAPARITKGGAAYFTNVFVGGTTYQYQMNDTGIYTFGDGSDGAVNLDGTNTFSFASKSGANYTLTRDVFALAMTVNNNIFLYTNGYRIFCQNSLTLVGGAQVIRDGNAGSGGTPGVAQADGYLKGGSAGGAAGGGGAKGNTSNGFDGSAGSAPTSIANSLTTQGGVAAARGAPGAAATPFSGGAFGAGGGAGSATARNIKPCLLWNFMSFFDVNADGTLSKYTATIPGSGGGGGGGGAAANANNGTNTEAGNGGAGGGGGGAGGIIFIAARSIVLNASCHIYNRGGAGGAGQNGSNALNHTNPTQAGGGGGGGGGSGGAGGIVFLVYNTLSNNGTIDVSGGAGGAAGTGGTGLNGGGTGSTGVAGSSGATGEIILINMAL